MALARGEREERWRWLTETETDDGAGSLRESRVSGELVHKERSQYSSTIDDACQKLRTELNGNVRAASISVYMERDGTKKATFY